MTYCQTEAAVVQCSAIALSQSDDIDTNIAFFRKGNRYRAWQVQNESEEQPGYLNMGNLNSADRFCLFG